LATNVAVCCLPHYPVSYWRYCAPHYLNDAAVIEQLAIFRSSCTGSLEPLKLLKALHFFDVGGCFAGIFVVFWGMIQEEKASSEIGENSLRRTFFVFFLLSRS
jgi:hypothetical protein